MKKVIISLLIIMSTQIYAQDWGVGIRLGDLSGITLKKYLEGHALELNVGRTHFTYGNKWYDNRFDDWYSDKKFGYSDFDYMSFKASSQIGIQLHYLFHKGIYEIADEKIEGLDWYFGFGAQLGYQKFYYSYRYKVAGNSDWFYANGETVRDIDIGGDGVIGLEYTFSEAPISLFLDLTLFMEVLDNPFLFWFQGGIGARYNF